MKITVTKEHIKNGKPNGCYCPIALATDTAMGDSVAVVTKESLYIIGYRRAFSLPKSARRFIKAFDEGKTVEPFDFEIEGLEATT